jgi:double-strand break repair protein MRE11
MPSEAILASMTIDNIRVEKLVHEFLAAQSLKVLPQAPFGDAVKQFVDKDDKHAMDAFVTESLSTQVNEIMAENAEEVDLDPIMERIRARQEAQFAAGILKRPKTKGKLKPRPHGWDSDLDGEWEDQPGAFEFIDEENGEDGASAPAAGRGNNTALLSDDDASVISTKIGSKAAALKKAPAKKAPAKPRAPVKAKAPAKAPARGRKKVVEPSDDEDEDEDVVMLDEEPVPVKSQPKRAAATKSRQTQLNFTQSQAKTQTARELSDDEISDDDAFEPMPSSRR